MSFFVYGRQVYIGSHLNPIEATIEISSDGSISGIHHGLVPNISSDILLNAGDYVVMPGIVDTHVHINEPGRTSWEGFETATKAAACGGCTTLIDMPLNSIPSTTSLENLNTKLSHAKGNLWVDVGFFGGVIPGNSDQLSSMIDAGVFGFKCFMIDSGVEEFPCVMESDIRLALQVLKTKPNSFLMFHAELENSNPNPSINGDYAAFLESRPASMETRAIELVISLCKEYLVPCHIVHLSSSEPLNIIKKAKQSGVPLTVETCFHYLCLSSDNVTNTSFKCCPPIRDESNREGLWKGLLSDDIDFVVSDHSPSTIDLKRGNFMEAWGGISSVQYGLPLMWTECSKRNISINRIIKWMCENTSKRAGLDMTKGYLKKGYRADIVIWDPNDITTVEKETIAFKNKQTAYMGYELKGKVLYTIVGGKIVFDKGKIRDQAIGEILLKSK